MKKILDKKDDNFLLYVPQKKHTKYEVKNGKVLLIFNHDKAIERFIRWLVKKPTVSDIELDEMGSFVWNSIDGQNTVHDISEKIIKKYSSDSDKIEERLIMYIRYLNRKGWIGFN